MELRRNSKYLVKAVLIIKSNHMERSRSVLRSDYSVKKWRENYFGNAHKTVSKLCLPSNEQMVLHTHRLTFPHTKYSIFCLIFINLSKVPSFKRRLHQSESTCALIKLITSLWKIFRADNHSSR